MSRHSTSPAAYSYIRFSSKKQMDGDSLRRQSEKAEQYCQRHGLQLDQSLNLHDLGVSAFRGKNALVGNLGVFLDEVKRGTVPAGSVLIAESIDRISRQGIDEGYEIVKGILKAGVRLVTLSPERDFGPEAVKSLSKGALEIQLILERAAEESERKSERVGAARAQERKRIRERQEVVTHRLPGWVEERGDKLALIPKAAAAVRQIFQLAAAGYGAPSIIRKLTADKVPPIGRTDRWTRSYLALLLRDRRVLGEYQPHRGKDKDGDVVNDYYPRAIEEDEWFQARAGAAQRRRFHGRMSRERVNIFAGVLRHARDNDTYFMTQRLSRTRTKPGVSRQFSALVNTRGEEGHVRAYSIPCAAFESAILSCLREIDPHEILNGDAGPDESLALAAQLAGLETELADAAAFLEKSGFSVTIGNHIAALEAHKAELAAELAEARQRAAHPLSESWGQMQSLVEILDGAADPRDARLRLRSALRRIIESIHLLVVPRGRDRLCAVQLWFTGGKRCRSYFIFHRAAGFHRAESWQALSLATVAKAGDLDLRQKADAAALERVLGTVDLDALLSEE
jgi:DNA invertase Pin-like site-specific DNA recombinase